MTTTKTFAQGLSIFPPSERAPEFIKMELSFDVDTFINFLKENKTNKYLKLTVKESSKTDIYGKPKMYAEVNTYTKVPPITEAISDEQADEVLNPEEIPF